MSLNPGKFQLWLAQRWGALHNPGKFQLWLAQRWGALQTPDNSSSGWPKDGEHFKGEGGKSIGILKRGAR